MRHLQVKGGRNTYHFSIGDQAHMNLNQLKRHYRDLLGIDPSQNLIIQRGIDLLLDHVLRLSSEEDIKTEELKLYRIAGK